MNRIGGLQQPDAHAVSQGSQGPLTVVSASETPSLPQYAAHSYGKRAASGAVWVFLASATGKVLGVATNLVLARLLAPDDFGLVSFSMVLIGAFTILQDLGVPASIIYSDRDVKSISGTALTINLSASVLLFGVAVAAAPYLADSGGDKDIAPVVIILAIGFVISSLGSVQRALFDKDLAFRRRFLPDVVPLILSGITSVVLAFLGFGAWSLVLGYIAKAIMSTVLYWSLSSLRFKPGFQLPLARELIGYGKHVSLVSIIGFIGTNADYVIVGHQLGTHDLGLYTLAFMIASLPITFIGNTASQVLFPAYSKVREDVTHVMSMFDDANDVLAVVTVMLTIGIFVTGPALVPIVFGDKWSEIGGILQLLVIHGAIGTISLSFSPLYKAIGRPGVDWPLNAAKVALRIALMIFLVRYELMGIAVAYIISDLIFLPLRAFVMGRIMNVPSRRLLRLALPHLAGMSLAAVVITAGNLMPATVAITHDVAGAFVLAFVAIGMYVVTTMALGKRTFVLLRSAALSGMARYQ